MSLVRVFTRGGFVEGLGDEEVIFRISPYVRDLVGLARGTSAASDPMPGRWRWQRWRAYRDCGIR